MKIRSRIIIVIVLISAFIVKCSVDKTCTDSVQSTVNIGFYVINDGDESDTTMEVFSAKGIVSHDGILDDSVNGVKQLKLPLSQLSEESSFIFTFTIPFIYYTLDSVSVIDSIINVPHDSTYHLYDTISFSYKPELVMISDECGFTHYFDLIEINSTNHAIKSDTIINPEITTSDEENVKIYL